MNPLHNPKGNFCVNCNERFVFSFFTFEVLPLVELRLDDLSDEEASKILQENTKAAIGTAPTKARKPEGDQWFEERSGNAELLKLNSNESNEDAFMEDLNLYEEQQRSGKEQFAKLSLNEVLVVDWPAPLRKKFYRNMVPDAISVSKCPYCNKFFQTDDFESQLLMHGVCLFCRTSQSMQQPI